MSPDNLTNAGEERAAHTPGPWTVPHFARPEVNCQCGYVLTDGLMGAVCEVFASGPGDPTMTGDNPNFEQAVANAHLIAAAPDLLAALKALVAAEDRFVADTDGQIPMTDLIRKAVEAARPIIDRAEGRRPEKAASMGEVE